MNREVHVRFWERAEVQFLSATRQNEKPRRAGLCQLPPTADMRRACEECQLRFRTMQAERLGERA